MFTITEIKAAHSKVKSGADFPGYVQDLIKLGVKNYHNFVSDGHTIYNGHDGYQLISDAKYAAMDIAEQSDIPLFKHALQIHQHGQTDYLTFCQQSAACGVEKWTVDMGAMTCTYYDKAGNNMLAEIIPKV